MNNQAVSKGIEKILGKLNPNDDLCKIDINLLEPDPEQPRKTFEENSIDELAQSIKNHGLLQPILVQKNNDKYLIIAGERRFRACQKLGLSNIPVKIISLNKEKKMEVSLIENLQREDLNPIDIAISIEKLIHEFNKTQEEVAFLLSKSRSYVTNILRILNLPENIKENIKTGKISFGHAKMLVGTTNPQELAKEIIAGNLSVRETEKRISEIKNRQKPILNDDLIYIQNIIEEKLKIQSKIEMTSPESGKIILKFQNLRELDNLLKITQNINS